MRVQHHREFNTRRRTLRELEHSMPGRRIKHFGTGERNNNARVNKKTQPDSQENELLLEERICLGQGNVENIYLYINRMGEICTSLLRIKGVSVGVVAWEVGGTVVTPPIDPSRVKHCVGDSKGFPQMAELGQIIEMGYLSEQKSAHDLNKALEDGNHRSLSNHLPAVWNKIFQDTRRNRCWVINQQQ